VERREAQSRYLSLREVPPEQRCCPCEEGGAVDVLGAWEEVDWA